MLHMNKKTIQITVGDMTHITKKGILDFLLPQINIQINSKGQSTIEFLSTFIFVFGLMFMFIRLALNATNGYLVHYATFMSSRAFLVADINSNQPDGSDGYATQIANNVFASFKVPGYIAGAKNKISARTVQDGGNKLFVGTIYSFEQKLSNSDIIGGKTPMKMTSESFLGREPTRATCVKRICDAMKGVGGDCGLNTTFFDNGC